jgi:hypothetical protein
VSPGTQPGKNREECAKERQTWVWKQIILEELENLKEGPISWQPVIQGPVVPGNWRVSGTVTGCRKEAESPGPREVTAVR